VFRAIFDKIKSGLSKTRQVFGGVASLFRLKGRVDKDFLAKLEEKLYLADVGVQATTQIVERVRQAFLEKEITGDVETFVKNELKTILAQGDTSPPNPPLRSGEGGQTPAPFPPLRVGEGAGGEVVHLNPAGPTVIMVAGINGSGKTTSIAKLAKNFKDDGKKVIVAACDTFRAAAVEQLTIWSQRIGCDIVKAERGSDPASVAHDACDAAIARKADVLIIDTAGRLHTQDHLMRELEKIHRIVSRQIAGAPHEVLLVLDATSGQNAIVQAEKFKKIIRCTGIILAKLDGTAKGGSIVPIKQKLALPVKFIGVGEKLDDLEVFDPDQYVEALFAE
jgi:fused signal recognition particle receptor